MALATGTHLGTHEILGPLGAGGMGEVYRAKDLRLGREIAIRVLPEEVASSPDRLARFEREARTVAGLNQPNVVVLQSVEDVEGVRFLTMELVEGQTERYQKALELAPQRTVNHGYLSLVLLALGRGDEALAEGIAALGLRSVSCHALEVRRGIASRT